jgi:hypothetical protein
LPVEQRLRVDAWLFEEGRTYEEVVEGCLSKFGLKVSRSSVGRYCERISADRFAKVQREKRMALEPVLSPAEAYKVLLKRIAELALEEMDQPLEEINHKVVVRLMRVLIAARREKHMETRVWVERRKVENWLARECLRHWRRTMKKKAHVSYLPMLVERKVTPLPVPLPHCVAEREKTKQNGGKQSSMSPPLSGSLPAQSLRGERDRRPWHRLTTKRCSPTQERPAIERGRVAEPSGAWNQYGETEKEPRGTETPREAGLSCD